MILAPLVSDAASTFDGEFHHLKALLWSSDKLQLTFSNELHLMLG